jgi:cytochrome c
MLLQPRYEPYGPSTFFDDGMAMRPQIEGTVARGEPLGPDELVHGEADGKDVVQIPLHVTREFVVEGRRSFDTVCAACHGLLGDGKSVVASKMQDRPPPSLHEPAIAAFPVGRLFRVITEGYGLMMPMGTLLSLRERWAVVAYVKALTLSQSVDAAELSSDERARLEAIR